ncbi:PAS domain-containing protein [uncultured Amphritea sp.]|uniref:PAS domain-containing protein n=1 Tax=uncultured Amphritea sp. TaxID=981605 RepID=UPI00263518C6|nr:PAS domain-containing protein [uncultured Amphritea sp.]
MVDNTHGKERDFAEGSRLISTTSLTGCITYANQNFIDIAGYSREELVGQPHNIVRHPDMPAAAFADLWTNLKADKPWLAPSKIAVKMATTTGFWLTLHRNMITTAKKWVINPYAAGFPTK